MRLETVAELSRAKAEVASAQGSVEELERLLKDSRCRAEDLEARLKAIESEKKNVDEAFTLAVDELAQYQEVSTDTLGRSVRCKCVLIDRMIAIPLAVGDGSEAYSNIEP
jgi:chromosome segregation ATPase